MELKSHLARSPFKGLPPRLFPGVKIILVRKSAATRAFSRALTTRTKGLVAQ